MTWFGRYQTAITGGYQESLAIASSSAVFSVPLVSMEKEWHSYRNLGGESLALHSRVVELGVRVADLLGQDEQLETLGQARLGAVAVDIHTRRRFGQENGIKPDTEE